MITLLVSLLIFIYLQALGSPGVNEHRSTTGTGSVVPNLKTTNCFGSIIISCSSRFYRLTPCRYDKLHLVLYIQGLLILFLP